MKQKDLSKICDWLNEGIIEYVDGFNEFGQEELSRRLKEVHEGLIKNLRGYIEGLDDHDAEVIWNEVFKRFIHGGIQ